MPAPNATTIKGDSSSVMDSIYSKYDSIFLYFFGLLLLGVNEVVSALAAAVAVSISPAVTLLIANEYGAQGSVVKHSLVLTALNNIMAFLLYAFVTYLWQNQLAGYFVRLLQLW